MLIPLCHFAACFTPLQLESLERAHTISTLEAKVDQLTQDKQKQSKQLGAKQKALNASQGQWEGERQSLSVECARLSQELAATNSALEEVRRHEQEVSQPQAKFSSAFCQFFFLTDPLPLSVCHPSLLSP